MGSGIGCIGAGLTIFVVGQSVLCDHKSKTIRIAMTATGIALIAIGVYALNYSSTLPSIGEFANEQISCPTIAPYDYCQNNHIVGNCEKAYRSFCRENLCSIDQFRYSDVLQCPSILQKPFSSVTDFPEKMRVHYTCNEKTFNALEDIFNCSIGRKMWNEIEEQGGVAITCLNTSMGLVTEKREIRLLWNDGENVPNLLLYLNQLRAYDLDFNPYPNCVIGPNLTASEILWGKTVADEAMVKILQPTAKILKSCFDKKFTHEIDVLEKKVFSSPLLHSIGSFAELEYRKIFRIACCRSSFC